MVVLRCQGHGAGGVFLSQAERDPDAQITIEMAHGTQHPQGDKTDEEPTGILVHL